MSWNTQLKKAMDQLRWCEQLASRFVMRWWGVSLWEFPTPLHPWLMALYWAHEGAKRYRVEGKLQFAPARHVLTNYPEIAPGNLTAKKGDDEVRRLGIHPYDIRSHAWACQEAFWEGRDWVDPQLRRYGYVPFDDLAAYDQLSLLLLQRAVGLGCVRGLLRRSKGAAVDARQVVTAMEYWIARPDADTTPFDGAQTTEVVRLRFAWCTRMVSSPIPGPYLPKGIPCRALLAVRPPVARPPDLVPLPADFHRQMHEYSRRARVEGPKPTGPWPKVTP